MHFAHGERPHGHGRIIDLLAAVEANFVGLFLEREWASEMLVTATKDDFIEEIKDRLQNLHELAPLLLTTVSGFES